MIDNEVKMIISKDNLIDNYNYIKNRSKKEVIVVIKSNAYGLGIDPVTNILYNAGVRSFAVSRYSEAKALLENNDFSDINILIFETIIDPTILTDNKNLFFTANSVDHLKYMLEAGVDPSKIHICIDMGFGRNGISSQNFTQLMGFIKNKNIIFGGLYSHLFSAAEKDAKDILNNFSDLIDLLGIEHFKMIHILSSESFYQCQFDKATHIRIGQLIYGIQEPKYPDQELKKVFSLVGQVEGIKDIKNNKYIGYDPKKKIRNLRYFNCAIIKLGYGDGFLSNNNNTTCVINDKEYDIISICMDHIFINVDDSVKVGDTVEFYHDTNKFFERNKFKIYEYLTCLSERIQRMVK